MGYMSQSMGGSGRGNIGSQKSYIMVVSCMLAN